jgi:hypothetical protein
MPDTTPDTRCGSWDDRLAKAQRVHHGDGTRAHGEDVAHDAAHAGGRALIGLDEAGWLWDSILKMAASPSPMSITPAFSRPLDHPGAPWWKLFQMGAGGFVGSLLAPHHGEDAQFDEGWFAAFSSRLRIFGFPVSPCSRPSPA